MPLQNCEACGSPFVAKRPDARFCRDACRKKASRVAPPVVVGLPIADVPEGGALTRATTAELDAAGRLESSAGAAALVLARRIDGSAADTGSAVAAMVREHRAALIEALRGAKAAEDPIDQLRQRREQKRSG